jgi:hypothetical protein
MAGFQDALGIKTIVSKELYGLWHENSPNTFGDDPYLFCFTLGYSDYLVVGTP